MNFLRQHIVVRTLWLLMAIHIFNCTIDAPDQTPPWMPEDLSYNEMETISEFVAEKIIGLDNFFPENDDNDSDDNSILKSKLTLDFFTLPHKISTPFSHCFSGDECHKNAQPGADQLGHQYLDEPNTPPPWLG